MKVLAAAEPLSLQDTRPPSGPRAMRSGSTATHQPTPSCCARSPIRPERRGGEQMTVEIHNPPGLPAPTGYAQVSVATGRQHVFVSGQVARNADGIGRWWRSCCAGRTGLHERRHSSGGCRRRIRPRRQADRVRRRLDAGQDGGTGRGGDTRRLGERGSTSSDRSR